VGKAKEDYTGGVQISCGENVGKSIVDA